MKPHAHVWPLWDNYDEFSHAFKNGFRYHRECQVQGCDARQLAYDLKPGPEDLVTVETVDFEEGR